MVGRNEISYASLLEVQEAEAARIISEEEAGEIGVPVGDSVNLSDLELDWSEEPLEDAQKSADSDMNVLSDAGETSTSYDALAQELEAIKFDVPLEEPDPEKVGPKVTLTLDDLDLEWGGEDGDSDLFAEQIIEPAVGEKNSELAKTLDELGVEWSEDENDEVSPLSEADPLEAVAQEIAADDASDLFAEPIVELTIDQESATGEQDSKPDTSSQPENAQPLSYQQMMEKLNQRLDYLESEDREPILNYEQVKAEAVAEVVSELDWDETSFSEAPTIDPEPIEPPSPASDPDSSPTAQPVERKSVNRPHYKTPRDVFNYARRLFRRSGERPNRVAETIAAQVDRLRNRARQTENGLREFLNPTVPGQEYTIADLEAAFRRAGVPVGRAIDQADQARAPRALLNKLREAAITGNYEDVTDAEALRILKSQPASIESHEIEALEALLEARGSSVTIASGEESASISALEALNMYKSAKRERSRKNREAVGVTLDAIQNSQLSRRAQGILKEAVISAPGIVAVEGLDRAGVPQIVRFTIEAGMAALGSALLVVSGVITSSAIDAQEQGRSGSAENRLKIAAVLNNTSYVFLKLAQGMGVGEIINIYQHGLGQISGEINEANIEHIDADHAEARSSEGEQRNWLQKLGEKFRNPFSGDLGQDIPDGDFELELNDDAAKPEKDTVVQPQPEPGDASNIAHRPQVSDYVGTGEATDESTLGVSLTESDQRVEQGLIRERLEEVPIVPDEVQALEQEASFTNRVVQSGDTFWDMVSQENPGQSVTGVEVSLPDGELVEVNEHLVSSFNNAFKTHVSEVGGVIGDSSIFHTEGMSKQDLESMQHIIDQALSGDEIGSWQDLAKAKLSTGRSALEVMLDVARKLQVGAHVDIATSGR